VNRRRVIEGYYHLIQGGLLQEAVEELCSLEFVCCSALIEDLSHCVRYLADLIRLFGKNDILGQLGHYFRWIRKRATKIILDPRKQTRMTAGEEPLISLVKRHSTELEDKELKKWGHALLPSTFRCEDFNALEMELVGHRKPVHIVAWNHDGSQMLSGSEDNTIKIWDGMTGELLHTLDGHSGKLVSISWNHDSSRIASGSSDGTITIWDAVTCTLLMTLKCDPSQINSLSWNHDSSQLASASDNGKLRIWDAITGELFLKLSGHCPAKTRSVSWNQDGSKLLSGSDDNTMKIWNALDGKLLKTLDVKAHVISASWNHDNTRIVSGSGLHNNGKLQIWDGVTGELLKTLIGHSNWVHSAIWNHDGSKILSGSKDDTIQVWDAGSGELEETVAEMNNLSVAWNQDGSRIASGSLDKIIRVWKGWKKETTLRR
jgi:WD40 repeat protein